MLLRHAFGGRCQVGGYGFRMHAVEQGVGPLPQLDQRLWQSHVAEEALQPARRRAAHGVVQDRRARPGDDVQIDQGGQRVVVSAPDVEALHGVTPAARLGHVLGPHLPRQLRHTAVSGVAGGTAVGALEFEAVPDGWVVGSGEHDAAIRPHMLHRERQRRSGQVVVGQVHLETVGCQHVGHMTREAGAHEAGVVPHHHAAAAGSGQVVGVGLRRPSHVGEREALGDDVAPAVRAEDELVRTGQGPVQLSRHAVLSPFRAKGPTG